MKKLKKFYILEVFFVLLIVLNLFVFQIARVSGISMFPTLRNGDFLFTLKNFYKIERNDIVTINKSGMIIKRVIGLPNDEVEYKDNQLYINGEIQKIDYKLEGRTNDFKFKLLENEYYVLGDNRLNSLDSRTFGSVKRSEIKSKVIGVR